jgi:predicted component of type VI protein secretion system
MAVLDVSKAELAADVLAAPSLEQSAIYRRLASSPPLSLIVGDFAFGSGEEDAALLTALGALGEAVGGPFIGGAADALVGCRVPDGCSNAASWEPVDSTPTAAFRQVRRSAAASYVGLAWPRWLVRIPYGARREPVESFAFEEVEGTPEHTSFLWGNSAYLAAAVIASAVREDPYDVPAGPFEVGDLALYAYDDDGESRMQPCGECWLSEPGIEAALARGIMPVASVRGHNVVRLVRLQSISDPAKPLARLGEG